MRGAPEYAETPLPQLYAHKAELTTRKYLTSGGKEYVPDGLPGHHSPFVNHLLGALIEGEGKGYLTFANIQSAVETTKPEPYGGDWGRNEIGSDFFFISKGLLSRVNPSVSRASETVSVGPMPGARPRYSVAVIGFENLSGRGEDSWISAALAEELTTELSAEGGLRPIAGEDVSRVKIDHALRELPGYSRDTLSKIRASLGADWVVSGSFSRIGSPSEDRIRVDFRVQNAQVDETVTQEEEGKQSELAGLVKRAGSDLRAKLGIPISSDATTFQPAVLPDSAEASKFYSQGLASLRRYDLLSARDLLREAETADPKFAMAHAALADTWFELGYDQNARQEGAAALDLSANLPLETRLIIEGSYRQKNADWERAIDIYSELWRDYPDDTGYALELASVQTAAGKGNDALETLGKLRKSDEKAADDPRVDYQEAIAAESLSDARRQQSAAARAAKKASQQGARLLTAEAYWQECTAFFSLGNPTGAEEACQKANQAADYAGAQKVKARSLTALSRILATEGKTSEAMEQREAVLQMARQIGSQKDIIGALMNLADLQATEGNVEEARKNEREAIGIAREIGDKKQLIGLENNLAQDTSTEGEYEEARMLYEDSLKNARETGDQDGIAIALQNLGSLSEQLGQLTVAEKDVRQGLAISQESQLQSTTASGLINLGDIQVIKADLPGARRSYEQALQVFTQINDRGNIAAARLALAKLSLEQGSLSESEAQARQAIEEFQQEKLVDNEAEGRNTLARALISEDKPMAAQDEINKTLHLGIQDYAIKLAVAITSARLKARDGKFEEAKQELDSELTDAKGKGLRGLEFDIRLALAEAAFPSDSKSQRDLRLILQRDATNSGYSLIAAKAGHE